MPRYARGTKSYGMSDRGGQKVSYPQLKTTWDGLRVAPDEWEPKHPQLTPVKNVIDAQQLFRPRPNNDAENVTIYIAHCFDPFVSPQERKSVGVAGYADIGLVDLEDIRTFPQPSGVAGTGAVGTETFESTITETGVAGTGGVGVEIPVVEVTGVSATGGAGAVGIEALNLSITETGVAGTGGVGTETPFASITEAGVAGTGGVGTESVTVNQEWGSGTWGDGTWGN